MAVQSLIIAPLPHLNKINVHVKRQAALGITRAYQHTPQRILRIELGLDPLEI